MLKGKFKAFRDLASSRTSSESAWESSLSDEEKDDLRHFKENFATALIAHKYPRAPKDLQERLASTMLLRRKQFLYLQWRHSAQRDKLSKTVPSVSQKLPAPSIAVAGPKLTLSYTRATTLRQPEFSGATPSSFSDTAFSESILSTHLRGTRSSLTSTASASLNSFSSGSIPRTTEDEKLEYPPKPKGTEPICPYCYQQIPRGDVWTNQKWFTHVDEDLKSYLCLFAYCHTPTELYSQESDWHAHMSQELRLNDGTDVNFSGEYFPTCPLCRRRDVGSVHIAAHFKFLALRCLPWTDDVEVTWSIASMPFTSASCISSDSDRFSSSSVLSFDEAPQHPPEESDEEFAPSDLVDGDVATSNSEARQHQWGHVFDKLKKEGVNTEELERLTRSFGKMDGRPQVES